MSRTIRTVPPGIVDIEKHFERGHVSFDIRHTGDGYLGEGIRQRTSKRRFKQKRGKKERRADQAEVIALTLEPEPTITCPRRCQGECLCDINRLLLQIIRRVKGHSS